jgi:hypothetical protein
MSIHAFKYYHFLELQDDNGDIVGYTAIDLFDHRMDQYVQPEDVADQITALHKILEQNYDPNEEPQAYYIAVQDARNTLESLTAFMFWPSINGKILGVYFFGGISPSKIGHIAPFLATIQRLSKACVFLLRVKISEGCFVSDLQR